MKYVDQEETLPTIIQIISVMPTPLLPAPTTWTMEPTLGGTEPSGGTQTTPSCSPDTEKLEWGGVGVIKSCLLAGIYFAVIFTDNKKNQINIIVNEFP